MMPDRLCDFIRTDFTKVPHGRNLFFTEPYHISNSLTVRSDKAVMCPDRQIQALDGLIQYFL